MRKVIRDGKVAVLYSPGFGAGWYTWNYSFPECVFDPEIVEMIENEVDWQVIAGFASKKYGEDFYEGGASDLRIAWIKQGNQFIINEYDGSESLHISDTMNWLTA